MTKINHRRRMDPEERREAILQAAVERFGVKPYSDVTISEVAEASGSSNALVYRYFGSKEDLYRSVVHLELQALMEAQDQGISDLPAGTPLRERVRVAIGIYLEQVEQAPRRWSDSIVGASEPTSVIELRRKMRERYVERLRSLLAQNQTARNEYSLWGFFGFLESAVERWVSKGCPKDDRNSIVEVALGSLEGALGDWGG